MPTSYSAVSLAFANTRRRYSQRASKGSTDTIDASILRIAVILALFILVLAASTYMVILNYVSDYRKTTHQRNMLLPHATSFHEASQDAN